MSLSSAPHHRARPHVLTAIALSIGVLAAGGAAAPASAATAESVCAVTDGTLNWGVKESFRSYISGTIAKGAWEAAEGASYTTPEFTWSGAHGSIDATGSGEVAFEGVVTFTGHNGLLRTTFANPTLVLSEGQQPQLKVDISGVSMEDALAGATGAVQTHPQIPMVALELDAGTLPLAESGEVAASAVAATITPEGFAAFGSYEAGTVMDPLSFSFVLECTEPVAETPEPEASAVALASEEAPADAMPAGVWWAVAGGALILAGAAAVWAVRRRRAVVSAVRDAHTEDAP